MKRNMIATSIIVLCVVIGFVVVRYAMGRDSVYKLPQIVTHDDLRGLFPATAQELRNRTAATVEDARYGIQLVTDLTAKDRTFENTIVAADRVSARLAIMFRVAWALQNVSTDADLRAAAGEALVTLQTAMVDLIENNVALYRACKEYEQGAAVRENLLPQERYCLNQKIEKFEKGGLGLPAEQQERIRALKKEIAQLSVTFDTNINNANDFITVSRADLAGCPDDVIDHLRRDDAGAYIVGTDYPTYAAVMEFCSVETTRRDLWRAFNNRAYPANEQVLEQLIAARDAYAKALGYPSYTDLELSDEMAKTPGRVHALLDELFEKSHAKVADEMALLRSDLPAGVVMSAQGQFKPWDQGYAVAYYKKKHFAIDEAKIKEYFPMQKTLDGMFAIYAQFLGIEFRQESLPGLWHEDVQYVGVYKRDGALLGHILLDMYPRPFKFSHGCMETLIPAVRARDGEYCAPVIIILTNFNKATADRPALFSQTDVFTLFHEFGHAMHGLLGATELAEYSGTSVKLDFVEMPSQMFEEWMIDPVMLKKVSGHYETGEPLPDQFIENLVAVKKFTAGIALRRQLMQSKLSLALFEAGAQKRPLELQRTLMEQMTSANVLFDDANRFVVSWGNLGSYASRYYCYLWAKVYALDMFEHIKTFGLLNHEIGTQYVDKVIGKGGSADPEQLIVDFLGREPRMEPFLNDLGF